MKWLYKKNRNNSARFVLGKILNPKGKTLICFGINPSTATPENLDNTVNKIVAIGANNGYENWIMLNIYPQRATNPNDIHLEKNKKFVSLNLHYIKKILKKYKNSDVLLAYGNLISKRDYFKCCLEDIKLLIISKKGNKFKVIKLTKGNNPVHPLYQPNNSVLIDYTFN